MEILSDVSLLKLKLYPMYVCSRIVWHLTLLPCVCKWMVEPLKHFWEILDCRLGIIAFAILCRKWICMFAGICWAQRAQFQCKIMIPNIRVPRTMCGTCTLSLVYSCVNSEHANSRSKCVHTIFSMYNRAHHGISKFLLAAVSSESHSVYLVVYWTPTIQHPDDTLQATHSTDIICEMQHMHTHVECE